MPYPDRDLVGYGPSPPDPKWPNGAKIAVSFVLNYEEGGEYSLTNGDEYCETYLTESGVHPRMQAKAARNRGVESNFEYGSRVGFWRVLRAFEEFGMRFTSWAVGRAVELNPQVVAAMESIGCEVASHSHRWIDYNDMPEADEEKQINSLIDIIQKNSPSNSPPVGWYTGRHSEFTRRICWKVYEERGLLGDFYDSDDYNDELPYYIDPVACGIPPSPETDKGLLILPYTIDVNDAKYHMTPGFVTATDFFTYAKDSFDLMYEEGKKGKPVMMSIGLHCRITGRAGRTKGLRDFMAYIKDKPDVWIATRKEIAQHWRKVHPYKKPQ
ncbi:carbohydrate esterase family 4 protein [Calocera cornea HHB12733]|uniref:Carbohydrate esterase family 4 protein n=1 Tax=Calocera cornea HHB12733 TaxID=1353952 RepID=A0A165HBP7_9BASI|nr:carbohydrate esterase family 4 protein [Calocera cornea HHB12733]